MVEVSNFKIIAVFLILVQITLIFYYLGMYTNFHIRDFNVKVIFPQNNLQNESEVKIQEWDVFLRHGIVVPKQKKNVSLLLIVTSGPRPFDRRIAIRETWWKDCKKTNRVIPECIFITDHQNEGDKFYDVLKEESDKYGDIRFQKLKGGFNFGQRYLYHLVYAVTHYNFDYMLRVDDDYFLCLDKFLHELPVSMIRNLHWGWVHCEEQTTRPEESMILFSRDVIDKFLNQDPNKMLCHPLADQMVALWASELKLTSLFRHDKRLHHHPIVSDAPELRNVPNICQEYMGVHGTYPADMRLFWTHKGPNTTLSANLILNSMVCIVVVPFDWAGFLGKWKFEPKLCIDNPIWDTSAHIVLNGTYSGRQEVKRISENS